MAITDLAQRGSGRILRVATGSLALRGFVLVAGFGVQFALTRLLPISEYSIYAFAIAWVRTLGVPATLGLERLIVREVADFAAHERWGDWRQLLRWSHRTLFGVSSAIALVAVAASFIPADTTKWAPTFRIAVLLLPLLTLTRSQQYVVQGMGHPILSQIAEALVLPVAYGAALGCFYLVTGEMSVRRAMVLNIFASALTLGAATVLLDRLLPRTVKDATPSGNTRRWARSITPLLLATGASAITLQIPTLLLGLIDFQPNVGRFAIARSLADLALIPMIALIPIWSPLVAGQWARRDLAAVQATVTVWARRTTLIYLPIIIVLMLFADPLLRLFGPAFVPAATSVRILCLGYLVNVMAGSNGILLITAGHERTIAGLAIGCAVLCAVLCLLLIPRWHLEGAAAAAATTMIVMNVATAWLGWSQLGVRPTVFARMPAAD